MNVAATAGIQRPSGIMHLGAFSTAAMVALVACGGAEPTMPVKAVVTATLPAGGRVAIVEVGTTRFAFDPDVATIVRGERVVSQVRAPAGPWQAAVAIGAPDHRERWIIGLSGGQLWRITSTGELSNVTDRIGVAGTPVLALAGAGSMYVVGLRGGFLVHADDAHVTRFAGDDALAVAIAKDRAAVATRLGIDLVDLAHGKQLHYPLTDVTSLTFIDATTDRATLAVAAGGDVYRADGRSLRRLSVPRTNAIAAAGGRLWLLAGDKVYVATTSQPIAEAIQPGRATAISASRTGGLWIADGSALATEVAVDVPTDQQQWRAVIAPVFERSCSQCHDPGGDADLDLSTAEAWTLHRAELVQRLIVDRTMPPPGYELREDERQTLGRWLE